MLSALKGTLVAKSWQLHMLSRSALSTVHAQQSVAATTQQRSMVCTVGSSVMCPSGICRTRVVRDELPSYGYR